MTSGDYRRTAEQIGRGIGLFQDGDRVIDGDELRRLNDWQLRELVAHTAVFARIRPTEKLRIIEALQANGQVTAMIGDGVNDTLAQKRANIGVVVGSATDVAKETADLVLLDNNFQTTEQYPKLSENILAEEKLRREFPYIGAVHIHYNRGISRDLCFSRFQDETTSPDSGRAMLLFKNILL